tara:strand:- start:3147 stop:4328 length:1182 start_codon:yes stop_codon:yes gene_type:complete
MGVKFISGFRGIDNAKQHLRRSVHAGSDLTSGNTVLNPSQAFDQQACFVYLNGVMQKEGSGTAGDYTLSGTSTVTFNSAVATTDVIEVVSYNFANPTLPESMIESNQTITSAQATYHATDVTGATYTASSDTITKSSQDLNVGDVISVTSASGTNTITAGRYKVKTRTSADAAVLEGMDNSALTFSGDGTAVAYTKVYAQTVNNLTLINKAMVFLNGMLLVEDTDYFRDQQTITFDSSVNLLQNHVVAIRNIGSFSTPSSTDVSNTGIEIADEGIATLLTADDFTSNVTCVFNLHVSARHATATNDAYRTAHILVRAQTNSASACYLHRAYDAGNISDEVEVKDAGNYSSISSFTDGKIGIGVTADANRWSVVMGNRAGHSIIAGFKALAITN